MCHATERERERARARDGTRGEGTIERRARRRNRGSNMGEWRESVAGRGDAHGRRGKRRARDPRASERASERSQCECNVSPASVSASANRAPFLSFAGRRGVRRSRASPPSLFFPPRSTRLHTRFERNDDRLTVEDHWIRGRDRYVQRIFYIYMYICVRVRIDIGVFPERKVSSSGRWIFRKRQTLNEIGWMVARRNG